MCADGVAVTVTVETGDFSVTVTVLFSFCSVECLGTPDTIGCTTVSVTMRFSVTMEMTGVGTRTVRVIVMDRVCCAS
jgi:hypothetical protein